MQVDDQIPRLLAIDDSVLIHRLLKARLHHERLEIHNASSGSAGLSMARQLKPDVILLDVAMPGIDGFEVLEALKGEPELHDIPVIFLSGSADTEDKVRALEMGAIDFVSKPFEIIELKARVRAALRVSSLIKLLARRAQVDGLTGLWNRAYFDTRLSQEVAEARRYDRPIALMMLDIDHFKPLNDTYGHPFGDFVLEQLGRMLEQGREGDIACRYGGEEFAIVMPTTTGEAGQTAAERVRRMIREKKWHDQPDLMVTASIGVADLSMCAEPTAERLLGLTDQALYAAKERGRDCAVLAKSERDGPGMKLTA